MAGKLYFPSVTVYRSFECIKTFALSSKCATFNVLCPTKKPGMDFTSPIWKKLDKFLKASQKNPQNFWHVTGAQVSPLAMFRKVNSTTQ